MKTLTLLDSKYENNQNTNDAILAKAELIKHLKKLGIEWFSNIEYYQENQYINFTIENSKHSMNFQVLIKEREVYYRYPEHSSDYTSLPERTLILLEYISNQNAKCHRFYTNDALAIFLSMIDRSLNQ
jgi:hypothetical protein